MATGLVASNGEARRAINDGGASVNNQKVTDGEAVLDQADWLHGEYVLVRRGKKKLAVAKRV